RERAERTQAVGRQRVGREEADDIDRRVLADPRAVLGKRVRDVEEMLATADEHRAALIAGGPQQEGVETLVRGACRADVEDRERERAPEEVVAGEVFAADD